MSTMSREVYAAFVRAGVDEDIAELKASLLVVKWMLGFNLAYTLVVAWRVFTPATG